MAVACGIAYWQSLVATCQTARRRLGQPTGRWSGPCLDAALQLAVRARHWPADRAAAALLAVARDPATLSPMRVAEAGTWWDDQSTTPAGPVLTPTNEDVAAAEAELSDSGGVRVLVQRQARAQLAAENLPVTRATVAVRALQLLHARRQAEASSMRTSRPGRLNVGRSANAAAGDGSGYPLRRDDADSARRPARHVS